MARKSRVVTSRSVFLPVSCFLYKVGEPKPVEKWSTYFKLEEQLFSALQRRFVFEGYRGFQEGYTVWHEIFAVVYCADYLRFFVF